MPCLYLAVYLYKSIIHAIPCKRYDDQAPDPERIQALPLPNLILVAVKWFGSVFLSNMWINNDDIKPTSPIILTACTTIQGSIFIPYKRMVLSFLNFLVGFGLLRLMIFWFLFLPNLGYLLPVNLTSPAASFAVMPSP